LDLSLAKAFGFPNTSVLGESARLEFRLDAYNIFNTLNFDPGSISNNIGDYASGTSNPSFGRAQRFSRAGHHTFSQVQFLAGSEPASADGSKLRQRFLLLL
jgi:hypothetical protein